MKISIVTISYNQAEFLSTAIQSIAGQSYDDLEYIVIDGGSTDGSVEVIQEYRDVIDYWVSEPDGGPPDGLNKGLNIATGEVFGFINADDFLLPGALDRVAEAFLKYEHADVVYGHGYLVDGSGERLRRIYSTTWNLRRYLYGTTNILQQATFAKTKSVRGVGGFNEENRRCWDGELWVDLSLSGVNWQRINEFLGAFRIHGESITGSEPTMSHSGESIYDRERKGLQERGLEEGRLTLTGRLAAHISQWVEDPLVNAKAKLEGLKSRLPFGLP